MFVCIVYVPSMRIEYASHWHTETYAPTRDTPLREATRSDEQAIGERAGRLERATYSAESSAAISLTADLASPKSIDVFGSK